MNWQNLIGAMTRVKNSKKYRKRNKIQRSKSPKQRPVCLKQNNLNKPNNNNGSTKETLFFF